MIVSGCSGGGKSTLLGELARRGFATVEEPGRRVVTAERAAGGTALPWLDAPAFAARLVALARADLDAAAALPGAIFFVRGLIDAAAALERLAGIPAEDTLRGSRPFGRLVFVTPPWAEIYVRDAERRHSLDHAMEEYDHLLALYPRLGYEPVILPKAEVSARADHLLGCLAGSAQARPD